MKLLIKSVAIAGPLTLAAGAAHAHGGLGVAHGLVSGFTHPITGADHLIAMIAIGLWASMLGGKARWLVPSAFVVVMVLGAVAAIAGFGLPIVEVMIVASVIALGALIAGGVKVPVAAATAIVAAFALFHGQAHGLEMPANAGGLSYLAGFAVATALLHGLGLAVGQFGGRLLEGRAIRLTGGAVLAAGLALMVGA